MAQPTAVNLGFEIEAFSLSTIDYTLLAKCIQDVGEVVAIDIKDHPDSTPSDHEYQMWLIKVDDSIKGDRAEDLNDDQTVEIVSPIFWDVDSDDSPWRSHMARVFSDAISQFKASPSSPQLRTNPSTGLHVHISIQNPFNLQQIQQIAMLTIIYAGACTFLNTIAVGRLDFFRILIMICK